MMGPLGPRGRHGVSEGLSVSIPVPADLRAFGVALAPDGRTDVVAAQPRTKPGASPRRSVLYLRHLDRPAFEPIRGTQGVVGMTVSPDSRWIAFFAPVSERSTKLRVSKVPIDASATPTPFMEFGEDWEGEPVWLSSGDMVVAVNRGKEFVRLWANGTGASPRRAFESRVPVVTMQLVAALPGDRNVFTSMQVYDGATVHVGIGAADLESAKVKLLVQDGGSPEFVPPDRLLFTRKDILYAVRFDPRALEIRGEPLAIMSGLRTTASPGNATFDLSRNGTLQTAAGGAPWANRRAVIVNARGDASEWSEDREAFQSRLAASPDGNRFASILAGANTFSEIVVSERGHDGIQRVVAIPGADAGSPLWSRDGRVLAFGQQTLSQSNGIYVTDPSGTTAPRRIVRAPSDVRLVPSSWSPDGTQLLCESASGASKIYVASTSPTSTTEVDAKPLFTDGFRRSHASFSPTGHVIAYESDETGASEIYACAWGSQGLVGEPVIVSIAGGEDPRWSRDGSRLYYVSPQGKLMAGVVRVSPRLKPYPPTVAWDLAALGVAENLYDLLPGNRLLAIQKAEGEGEISRFDLTLHFFEDLERRLKIAKK